MIRPGWMVAAAVALAACAEPATDGGQRAIVGGSASSDDAVVALLGHVGSDTYLCTGALIGPRTVLTAAHCVADRDGIDAVFATDIHDDGTVVATIAATEWEPHPSWSNTASDLFDQHYDLGLVLLASDAPATPLGFNRSALVAGNVGGAMRLIGYGNTSNGATDSGTRLVANTTLREYDDWWTTAGSSSGTTCVGDSGGPQLMMIGGSEVVVGVTSFGTAPPNEALCQFDTIAARVDIAAADFIEPFLAENDPPAGDPDAGSGGGDSPDAGSGGGGGGGGGGGDDEGGGCSTGGNGGGALVLLAAAALAWRRRQLS